MTKYVIVQAVDFSGAIKFNQRIKGKKNRLPALREAMECLPQGGYMREQTEGAKGWAVYEYQAGAKQAMQLFSNDSQHAQATALFADIEVLP